MTDRAVPRPMTDAGALALLHTGTHTGIWGTVEVAFAVGVLLVSVGLVTRLLLDAREGTPGAGLAEALSAGESRVEDPRSGEGHRSTGGGTDR